ncbi:hypothetical protein G6F43_013391 [Rhizopus delemar]|nr:hypothetical protein G6F43_013391 [Rhizopus delemar]
MSPPTTDDRLVGLISQLVSENRLANTIICAKYDPKTNFNHWLSNYEAQCDRLALTINHKKLHIASYLPDETATVGQKTAARNPFFLVFVAHILLQWHKLPLFPHSKSSTCLEKSERV